MVVGKSDWKFFYDEDGFIIAENKQMEDDVCHAISDFMDDLRNLGSVGRFRVEWTAIKHHYPEYPIGFAKNATAVTLTDGGMVEIKSYYEQFDTVKMPEVDFSYALDAFEEFLRGQE
ncbi:hypothetical protein ACFYUD_07490 [Nocardia tengchongensis]|uniref:hypothetical protein n=1 Tax=Nocardia tengchongensis TaxID=2055889 RepID=UPI00369D34A3